VRALSILFRAKFRDAIAHAGVLAQIDPSVWSVAWNVHCQSVGNAQNALAYLSRYVFKVAIANERILEIDDAHVRFAYTASNSHRRRTMTLNIEEFIRRFLQHVLPTGFMKVRYYGFLSPSLRRPIEEIRTRVEMAHGFELDAPTVSDSVPPQPLRCEHCGARMRRARVISSRPIAVRSRTGHAEAHRRSPQDPERSAPRIPPAL
jgi:nuclear transport factor 2 (NTF2) superfamily protein